jgi:hypothetical protein
MSKTYAIGWLSTSKIISIERARRRRVVKRQNDAAKCLSLVEAFIGNLPSCHLSALEKIYSWQPSDRFVLLFQISCAPLKIGIPD